SRAVARISNSAIRQFTTTQSATIHMLNVTQHLNKMSKTKIIVIHLAVFVLLTILLFFSSEFFINKFAEGFHDIKLWIGLITYGTIGILILTIISCLIFLKQKKLIGLIIIIINLVWVWFSLDLLFRYHFTEFHPTFYIPNWILIVNCIFAIVGIIIGFKLIIKKVSIKRALIVDFTLILIGLIIQLI